MAAPTVIRTPTVPPGDETNAQRAEAIPPEGSLYWYFATVVLPFVPVGLLWVTVFGALHKILGLGELFGKGELLYIAIPIASLAVASVTIPPARDLQTALAARQLRRIVYALILVSVNAGALLWLGAFVVLKLAKPDFNDFNFIPGSIGFFLLTVAVGALAVGMRSKHHVG